MAVTPRPGTALGERTASGRMLRDLVSRVFDGSAASLMLNLIETSDGRWRWAEGENILLDYYANSTRPFQEMELEGWTV